MKLLVLGGTVFLGRAIVEAAVVAGHQVTTFTRGQHNPGLFPRVEMLYGDRGDDVEALRERRWDTVIDTSGYVPRVVRQNAELLRDSAAHYTFVSTLSVYADFSTPGIDESAPAATLDDESTETVTDESYGPLKALCERAAQDAFPHAALVVRPGLIVGPHDPSDRFTYWPVRVASGGEVLAPGRPEHAVQFIDVRDLAEWILRASEAQVTGVFNANGPAQPVPMKDVLEACKEVAGSDARFTWVPDSFLEEQKVGAWMELPLWLPETEEYAGFFSIDSSRAIKRGLTFRPIADTARATLEWARTRPANHEWKAGLSREREAELLAAWKLEMPPARHPQPVHQRRQE